MTQPKPLTDNQRGSRMFGRSRPLQRGPYLVRTVKGITFLLIADLASTALRLLTRRLRALPPVEPKRILVSNWASYGDVLLCLPALARLRAMFPDAEIDIVAAFEPSTVFEKTQIYRQLHRFSPPWQAQRPGRGKITNFLVFTRAYYQFAKMLRGLHYDVAIDLYAYFPNVILLFWLAKIPVRCGFTSGGLGPLLSHPVRWSPQGRSMTEISLDLLKALWPNHLLVAKRLAPSYPGYEHLRHVTLAPNYHNTRYIVIHMGAGVPFKLWPAEKWKQLARKLAEQPIGLVVSGSGEAETERARELACELSHLSVELSLDRPWPDHVALIAKAAAVVCLDSSTAHLAAAFQVPTVAIFPGINEPGLWGPSNPKARVLTAPTDCAPCHRSRGCASMYCVRGVEPEDVFSAIQELLSRDEAVLAAEQHPMQYINV